MAIDYFREVVGALIAGLLSFISPCVLPLVLPYLGYLAGVSLNQLTGEASEAVARRTIVLSALAFVLGFTTVFVALGATASAFGQWFRGLLAYQIALPIVTSGGQPIEIAIVPLIAGGLIVAMGLHFLGVYRIAFLHRQARLEVRNHPAGPAGSYLVGLAFAIGWTPCIGPVLATILAVAGSEQTVGRGAILLAVYSLGLGVPFVIAGFFAGAFMRFMRRFRRHIAKVEHAMGAFLVLAGILFITGDITKLSFWLLDMFPGLAQLG
jgi:cytochrome c-type biogenesis protein